MDVLYSDGMARWNNYMIVHIPVTVQSISCVGVESTFPRGHGNYMSIVDESVNMVYQIVNLSHEDLQDLIEKKYIGDKIAAHIFKTATPCLCLAYIVDERIPKECLTPLWFYGVDNTSVVNFMRSFHKVPVGTCICKGDKSKDWALFNYRSSRTLSHNQCRECGDESLEYRPGWHSVNIEPDMIESEMNFKVIVSVDGVEHETTLIGTFTQTTAYSFKFSWADCGSGKVIKWKYIDQE